MILLRLVSPFRRSKSMVLKALKTSLGRVNLKDISPREIDRVRKEASRARRWAGNPCDRFLFHSNRAHARCGGPRNRGFCGECSVGPGCAEAPRSRGKSNERDHRPTQDELNRLIEYAECNPLQFIPLGRIIRFAVATAMRQAEILPDRMA